MSPDSQNGAQHTLRHTVTVSKAPPSVVKEGNGERPVMIGGLNEKRLVLENDRPDTVTEMFTLTPSPSGSKQSTVVCWKPGRPPTNEKQQVLSPGHNTRWEEKRGPTRAGRSAQTASNSDGAGQAEVVAVQAQRHPANCIGCKYTDQSHPHCACKQSGTSDITSVGRNAGDGRRIVTELLRNGSGTTLYVNNHRQIAALTDRHRTQNVRMIARCAWSTETAWATAHCDSACNQIVRVRMGVAHEQEASHDRTCQAEVSSDHGQNGAATRVSG